MLENDDLVMDNTITNPEDNTSDKNEDILNEFPDEDGDITDEKGKEVEKKPEASEIIQKKKYREKLRVSKLRINELELENEELKNAKQSVSTISATDEDNKEKAAQKYIREQAKLQYDELKAEEKRKETEKLKILTDEMDEVLEEFPDLDEEEIADTCEEYEVSPKVAAKFLNKSRENKAKKPKLPQSKRGTGDIKEEEKVNDKTFSSKSLYDIGADIKRSLRKKLNN